MAKLTVELTQADAFVLRRLQDLTGENRTELVRRALRELVRRERSKGSSFKEALTQLQPQEA